jgi:cellobiose phosphorylase
MASKYGYFDGDAREYVIIRPDTPAPWYNYIYNGLYGGLVSHTGGGLSFYKDPRHRRFLRYRFNNLPADRPGRYLYLRDDATGKCWSATWAPTCPDLKRYQYRCHVGLGYQRIVSRHNNIETEVAYFVPPGDPCEIWLLKVRNLSNEARSLSVLSYAEMCMWGALRDMTNLDAPRHTTRIGIERDGAILHSSYTDIGSSLAGMQFVQFYGFAAVDRPFHDYDMNREDFIGANRGEANPLAVESGKHTSRKTPTGNPLASFHNKLRLKAHGEEQLVYVLGVVEKKEDYKAIVRKYTKPKAGEAALTEVKTTWLDRLLVLQAETPDKGLNEIVNTWNPYQCYMTLYLSRSIAPYSIGIGRGMGYRDTSQDCLAGSVFLPAQTAQRLEMLFGNQFADGTASHNFYPDTGEGEGADFYDDHLWTVLATAQYCKETGDLDFVNRKVKFRDKGQGTILEHIGRALDASWRLVGKRKLCLTGVADWNDSVNPPKGSESVFTSMLFCKALEDAIELAGHVGEPKLAKQWDKWHAAMKKRINEAGWDGEWYKRHILPDGSALGTRKEKEGQIFLEPQVWSIMAGVATPGRAEKIVKSIKRRLLTPDGVKLCDPPYSEYNWRTGSVGIFRPGLKENGSVFNHTNPWVIVALCMLGKGDEAFDIYKRISPFERNKIIDRHVNDPYVFNQFHTALPHPEAGRAWNAWLTGTASWAYVSLSQYILGVRPNYDGLVIDPCVPRGWKKFTVTRVFRNATYEISVSNPKRKSKGVAEMTVDGKAIRGNKAPIFADGKLHKVKLVMG